VKKASNIPQLSALPKECGELKNGVRIYQPIFLKPAGTPRPTKKIAALVDKRPLEELDDQVEQSVQQILFRAYTGDAAALRKFTHIVCGAVKALGRLAQFRAAAVKTVAETFPTWPVLLSLNPQEIQRAKDELLCLGVGAKAPAPTRPGQRLDPHNFWTQLAARAFEICRSNKYIVPVLRAHCAGTRQKPKTRKFWRTEAKATIYTRADGSVIVIPDWTTTLPRLSEPVTPTAFPNWWKAVKLCVLDYWKMYPQEYAKALQQIGRKEEEEWRRRNLALTAVRHAFRSLVKLR
jgi:hypothetical protein